MSGRLALVAVLAACSAKLHQGGETADASLTDGQSRSNMDAIAADAPAMLGPWGTPQPIPGANDPALAEDDGTPNQALTELYFGVVNANTAKDLYWMQRANATAPWGPKTLLYQSANNDESPRLSLDELTLYFGRNGDIYQMQRSAVGQPWGPVSIVPAVNVVGNGTYEKWMAVCQGGYYMLARDADLWEGTLGSPPTKVDSLSTTGSEISTWLSADCKTVMFARTPLNGQSDIYISTRATATAPWPAATVLPDFNTTTSNEEDPWMSNDMRTFVFASNAGGTKDIYLSTR
jgi:WD40-like Beta Propeller Repeat